VTEDRYFCKEEKEHGFQKHSDQKIKKYFHTIFSVKKTQCQPVVHIQHQESRSCILAVFQWTPEQQ